MMLTMKLIIVFLCVSVAYGVPRRRTGTTRQGVFGIPPTTLTNMLDTLRNAPVNMILGDSFNSECTYNQRTKRTRRQSQGFNLDFWSAMTCTFSVVSQGQQSYARLYNPNRSVPGVSLQTLYLPIFEYNTASFTIVPRTLGPSFFITATLTGCDVFVASAGTGSDVTCPLVLIHTNACGQITTDINHQQAIAVLSLDLCSGQQYQIKFRMASSTHRSVIEPGHYHYNTDYYNMQEIFYGFTYGGQSITTRQPWAFCRKTSNTCYTEPDF